MAADITIIRVPQLPDYSLPQPDDQLIIWSSGDDTTRHILYSTLKNLLVTPPIKFRGQAGVLNYQSTDNSAPGYVADLARLISGAEVDGLFIDSSFFTPQFYTPGTGTFDLDPSVSVAGGEYFLINFHLP